MFLLILLDALCSSVCRIHISGKYPTVQSVVEYVNKENPLNHLEFPFSLLLI